MLRHLTENNLTGMLPDSMGQLSGLTTVYAMSGTLLLQHSPNARVCAAEN